MTSTLNSQPEPLHISRASTALAAVLAGHPDIETRLTVAGALAILGEVYPPYPPLPEPKAPLPPARGIATALIALSRAAAAASNPEEAIRVGLAARKLHDLTPRP